MGWAIGAGYMYGGKGVQPKKYGCRSLRCPFNNFQKQKEKKTKEVKEV